MTHSYNIIYINYSFNTKHKVNTHRQDITWQPIQENLRRFPSSGMRIGLAPLVYKLIPQTLLLDIIYNAYILLSSHALWFWPLFLSEWLIHTQPISILFLPSFDLHPTLTTNPHTTWISDFIIFCAFTIL